ncbi:MAG: hypothetical protein GY847_38520 [Proteobacteria bacterium]|nr:hypothetical protein [Pseudomonadota bacterium]
MQLIEIKQNYKNSTILNLRSALHRKTASLFFLLVFSLYTGISQGGKKDVSYVPQKLPTGFDFNHQPAFYGTSQKPLKNGTIFDYINGGGEAYIKHGFRSVTHIVLKDKKDNTIVLDIYNMGKPKNARATLSDEVICPKGFKDVDIGKDSKSYNYEPDFIIYFVKGKHFIYLAINNDIFSEKLLKFAKQIFKDIR